MVSEHEGGFEGEFLTAHNEKILDGRPQQIHHHQVGLVLVALPVHLRKAGRSLYVLEYLCLGHQLQVLGLLVLPLHRVDLLSAEVVDEVDLAERPAAYLWAHRILAPDFTLPEFHYYSNYILAIVAAITTHLFLHRKSERLFLLLR